MESKMKNKLALLSVLLIAGLLMAGIGTALGAENLLRFDGMDAGISSVTTEDGTQVLVFQEDGKVVKEINSSLLDYYISSSDTWVITYSPSGEGFIVSGEPSLQEEQRDYVTEDSGEPASGVSCFINGQQLDPANCPKLK